MWVLKFSTLGEEYACSKVSWLISVSWKGNSTSMKLDPDVESSEW